MKNIITPLLTKQTPIVIGSPVYFNNVSAQLKDFMNRTWALKGRLRNKLCGAIIAGRGYGSESAITAIHTFFFKHDMIPVHRGVCGTAFNAGEIKGDLATIKAAGKLGNRILEIESLFSGPYIKSLIGSLHEWIRPLQVTAKAPMWKPISWSIIK